MPVQVEEKEEKVKVTKKSSDENIKDKIVNIEEPWYDKYSGKIIIIDLKHKFIKNPKLHELDFHTSDSWSWEDVALFVWKFLIL